MQNLNKEKGFTLIEILIVVGLLGILFAFVSTPLVSFYRKVVFQGTTENIMAMMDEARKSTLSSYNSSQYGVHFEPTSATLFTGATYVVGDSTNDVYELSNAIEISDITFNGGGSDIVFERITGETNEYGSITITSLVNSTSEKTINIFQSGLVEIEE
jgi:prepilin-type N-terminal cleavage/methylation domain-containing protein